MSAGPVQITRARWSLALLVVGAAGLLAALVVAFFQPRAFYYGYTCGFLLWTGIPLGAAGLLLVHLLTGGRWGWTIRRATDAAIASLPLVVVAFVPIAIGVRELYPWATHEPPGKPEYAFRAWYLREGFFYLRAVIILAIWVTGGLLLLRATRTELPEDPGRSARLRGWAAAGLIAYFLTITFAATDWFLTLEKGFYSSVYGFYVATGQGVTVLAVFILLRAGLGRLDIAEPLSPTALGDLGTLLLTFVVLYGYIAYAQFFIIWNGNLPHEAEWYAARMRGGWGTLALVLIIVHLLLPLFALLFRGIKRRAHTLVAVAAIVLGARLLDTAWMVLPSAHDASWLPVLAGFAAMVGLGGIWLAAMLWCWRWAPSSPATLSGAGS